MRTNNKHLTSQAHAASQVNVKPTTKANICQLPNNQKTAFKAAGFTGEQSLNTPSSFLFRKKRKIYSDREISSIPAGVLKDIFERTIFPESPSVSKITYQKGFNELSINISLLWDNITTRKSIQSFFHISEKMQILSWLQFFFKCVLDPKEELLVDDQKFCKGLFFNSIIEENIEQSINSICEANVIVTNALKMAWGNGYIDNVDNLEFFHKLYIFYSECNDYFISNPENN